MENYTTQRNNLSTLNQMLEGQDWYDSLSIDEFGRLVVHANQLSTEIENKVPRHLNGQQVMLHFPEAQREKYVDDQSKIDYFSFFDPLENEAEDEDDSILNDEFNLILSMAPVSIIEDIFYEYHDGKNAVTDYSQKYPTVRESVEKLYNIYGFDLLFDKIEKIINY